MALIFAPLAVVPFIFLGRMGYLRAGHHWGKFWLDDLLYLVIVSYLGSAIAAPLTMLMMRVRRISPSIGNICAWFTLISATIAVLGVFAISRSPGGAILSAVLTTIGAAAVSLAYGLIAAVPWRAIGAGTGAEVGEGAPGEV